MEFSRHEYWSGLPCPPAGDLPNPGTKPAFPVSPALAGGFFITSTTWEVQVMCILESAVLHGSLYFYYESHIKVYFKEGAQGGIDNIKINTFSFYQV